MKAAAIDDKKLLALCLRIRQLKSLSVKERRLIVETLLKEIDLIKIDHVENLCCIHHAMELRKYKNHSSVYRTVPRNGVHIFKVCCRDFFARAELAALPVKGEKKRIKVGMTR